MPPAGPVDRYVPRYTGRAAELPRMPPAGPRWIVTFLATRDSSEAASNATGWPGGSLRSSLQWLRISYPNRAIRETFRHL